MNIIERFIGWAFGPGTPGTNAERRALDSIPGLTDVPTGEWRSAGGAILGAAGATNVTPNNAMSIAAVYACVRVLAESVASLPFKPFRRTPGGKEVALNHRLYSVLHDMANPEMTSFEFREMMMAHLCLWGNHYSEIEMNGRTDVLALWPLPPDRVTMSRDDAGELIYLCDVHGRGRVTLPAYRVFHVRGLASNGIKGLSPIAVARNTLRLAANVELFGAAFFDNNATPGGVLEHPGKMSVQAYDRLKTSWEQRHSGPANAGKPAILEEGIKWSSIGMPMSDAQFLETRKFQVSEIARIFRVPPHLIQDLDKATFSNIEHQSLDFVIHALRPWLVRIEQAVTRCLIGEIERKTIFAEFNVDGLLRGDIKTRYDAYAVGRNWGWLSRNDVRRLENMNDVDGGDDYLTPLNMTTLGVHPPPAPDPRQPGASGEPEPSPSPQPSPPGGEGEDARALDLWIADAVQRIEARTAEERDYAKHGAWVTDVLAPVCAALYNGNGNHAAQSIARWWLDAPASLPGAVLARTVRVWQASSVSSDGVESQL